MWFTNCYNNLFRKRKTMATYTSVITEDENGELLLEFPPESLEELGWVTGDTLIWTDNGDNTWTLRRA